MTNKDKALIDFIVDATAKGTMRWEPTASENEFLATLRGSHIVTITRNDQDPDVLTLRNANGQEILVLDGNDDNRINRIHRSAQRNAFDVDKTIDEIIGPALTPESKPETTSGPITDEDIPF